MKLFIIILSFVFISPTSPISKESIDKLCFKRGFEVILPYEEKIANIKENKSLRSDQIKIMLRSFKANFEKTFYGLTLYKAAGCSQSRMEEYMSCLVETDGKDCKIYYSQMRLVD